VISYADVISSLCDIVCSNRKALGTVFFKSLDDSIVEEFLILVPQLATCSVGDILIVNKFPSFNQLI